MLKTSCTHDCQRKICKCTTGLFLGIIHHTARVEKSENVIDKVVCACVCDPHWLLFTCRVWIHSSQVKLDVGWSIRWLFKNDVSEFPIVFSSFLSPSLGSSLSLPSSSPHFRPLMLPLTCTASMVCPLPETQVQLSMVTRSVYRLLLSLFRSCYLTFHLSVERVLSLFKLNSCSILCCSSAGHSVRSPSSSIVGLVPVISSLPFYPL